MKKTARRSYPVFELYLNTSYSAPPKSTSGQFAAPRRLTYYLVKAPSRFHQMASYYFYPACRKLEIGRFCTIFQKPEVIERYTQGVKCYVPLALSNGIWIRALGLPVLVGHREVCFFKAPSRFTRWRLIISIPLAKSWKSAVFPRYFKNRK